jgi:hypothetical protein
MVLEGIMVSPCSETVGAVAADTRPLADRYFPTSMTTKLPGTTGPAPHPTQPGNLFTVT